MKVLRLIRLNNMKYLGIDYGLRKIGLATGELESSFAVPFGVIERTEDVIERLLKLCQEEGIDAVVVGMPERVQGEVTQQFIDQLTSRTDLPIHVVGEAYTSVAGESLRREEGSGVEEDALAAMIILQEFFDSKRVNF